MDYVEIFDTTLRDGEQSPGATMTSQEKVDVAHALSRLGVDVMEAGFPAASPDDLAAVRRVAEEVGRETPSGKRHPPGICALARTTERDIDQAAIAVEPALRSRIHVFLATSPIHREFKLRMTKSEVVETARRMVAYAKARCHEVEFSAEDASRTEPEFLRAVFEAALDAGARYLNVPDTVGYAHPEEYGALIRSLTRDIPGIERAVVSVHCHNDLGLAVANTLAGVAAGARQAEVTINGIGERAGNAALEEFVMALSTRRDVYAFETGIDTTRLAPMSHLISRITGMVVQPNKAIVGKNAFSHEAGIHQDGMLKSRTTYEIMTPETVGVAESTFVLGKHSGRRALKARLLDLGFELDEAQITRVFAAFKELADRKKHITDDELVELVDGQALQSAEAFSLEDLRVTSSTRDLATATVTLRDPVGGSHTFAAVGSGPVDAAFKAIDCILKNEAELVHYHLVAVTEGNDALGEATVRIRAPGHFVMDAQSEQTRVRTYRGTARNQDVICASAHAYLAAHNSCLRERARSAIQAEGTVNV